MRALIVRLGSIGDIVHAMPLVGALRGHLADAEVDWVVEASLAGVVAHVPWRGAHGDAADAAGRRRPRLVVRGEAVARGPLRRRVRRAGTVEVRARRAVVRRLRASWGGRARSCGRAGGGALHRARGRRSTALTSSTRTCRCCAPWASSEAPRDVALNAGPESPAVVEVVVSRIAGRFAADQPRRQLAQQAVAAGPVWRVGGPGPAGARAGVGRLVGTGRRAPGRRRRVGVASAPPSCARHDAGRRRAPREARHRRGVRGHGAPAPGVRASGPEWWASSARRTPAQRVVARRGRARVAVRGVRVPSSSGLPGATWCLDDVEVDQVEVAVAKRLADASVSDAGADRRVQSWGGASVPPTRAAAVPRGGQVDNREQCR